MHIALIDFNWTGHHTPYAVFISRYFVEKGHFVTFVTDRDHPRLDELPDHERLSVQLIDCTSYKSDRKNEIKNESGEGFIRALKDQSIRTKLLYQLLNKIGDIELDILHFLYFERNQIPIRMATRLFSGPIPPIVVTLHRDAFTERKNGGVPNRLTSLATSRAIGSCLSDGTIIRLTVHSDNMRDRIIESVPRATLENIQTIPAPTPCITADGSKKEARAKLELPEDDSILLFFGEHRYEKGPDILFNALCSVDRPVTAVFAGPENDVSQKEIKQWQTAVNPPVAIVERAEFIPEEEVDYYFLAADALVLPYRRERGISGPLIRACMANTHIIGPANSDIGRIIERHDLGQTFEKGSVTDLRQTITTFIDDQDQYPTETVVQYGKSQHWRETGKTLENIYRKSIKSREEKDNTRFTC